MKKALFPLMVLLVVACTAGIYYLLFDEHSTLFHVNTIVTCLAEVLLLANIPIWSGEKMMTVKNAAASVSVNIYAVLVFLWTTVYTLAIYNSEEENYKPLIIGLLGITLLFVILYGATMIGGGVTEKHVEELQTKSASKKLFVFSVQESFMNIKEALHDEESEWKDETLKALRTIADKIGAMPTDKLSKNTDITSELKDRMDSIAEMCEGLATADNKAERQAKITHKVNQLKNYLTTIKTIM